MTFDVEPQDGTAFHVSSHLVGRSRIIFGGLCLRESPRPYAHYINWSICGCGIKFAETTPVKSLYVLLIAQGPYLNRSNRSSFAG